MKACQMSNMFTSKKAIVIGIVVFIVNLMALLSVKC